MNIKILLFFLIISIIGCSCGKNSPDDGKRAILEVGDNYLYQEDIDKIIPAEVSANDSTAIVDKYIKKWATNILIYENARQNTSNQKEIDEMVEEYRKSLIIHQYEQKLIEQRLRKKPTDTELLEFYNEYKKHLILKESVIKGLLLIVPKNASDINEVRSWIKSGNTNALEKIEKYSVRNALSYDYFYDNWLPLSEIFKEVPSQAMNIALGNTFHEITDDNNYYFLRIESFIPAGKEEPFELVKENLNNILLIKYKNDFIESFENELYDDAIKRGKLKFISKPVKKRLIPFFSK